MKPRYTVNQVESSIGFETTFDQPPWSKAELGRISNFLEKSSDHRPDARFRVLHNDTHLFIRFQVADRYVRSVQTEYQSSVCGDSCTEFFVRPRPDKGYFNFEVNAGGTMLLYYIEDPTRTPNGFKKWQKVTPEWAKEVKIWHSLPAVVDPTIVDPIDWGNGWSIPMALFEAYAGPLGTLSGQHWQANFYKCGGDKAYPHWATWSPVSELNFHLPECFGDLVFA